MTTPPKLYTPAEAAEYLRTTEGALRQLRNRRSGPRYVKAGHRVLYTADDLVAYLQDPRQEVAR